MTRSHSEACSPGSGVKRKLSEASLDGDQHKRAKKVSTACDHCKKRKVKCNGETPCRRCRNLQLSCTYVPNSAMQSLIHSSDFKSLNDKVSELQDQIEQLRDEATSVSSVQRRLDFLEGRILPRDPGCHYSTALSAHPRLDETRSSTVSMTFVDSPWPPPPLPQCPQSERRKYHGPTSSIYDVEVAKSSLCRMGINGILNDDVVTEEEERQKGSDDPQHPLADPLWNLTRAQATEAAQIYEMELGVTYPLFDIAIVLRRLGLLYPLDEVNDKRTQVQKHAEDENEINVVRLVLALGCLLQGGDREWIAKSLYTYMGPVVSQQILQPPSLTTLILLILTAIYVFHTDDEGGAWRLIGIAARSCYEMGLHRKEPLQLFADPIATSLPINLFWIVYALDRQWSFGTGMPFAIYDSDIDSTLPEPADDNIYLKYTTRCNKIMSKIWSFNLEFDSNNLGNENTISYLEHQVHQWYDELPIDLKLTNDQLEETCSRKLYKMRVLLRLRANHAVIHIYRPILHSATNIHRHLVIAKQAVDVARDTITLLIRVNQVSSIYRDQQILYNYFLVQALAVIFLAISHAPAEFLNHTRKEFYEVLDLIKGFTMNSQASRRLWYTIQELKRLRDQIRLLDTTKPTEPNIAFRRDSQLSQPLPSMSSPQQGFAHNEQPVASYIQGPAPLTALQQKASPIDGSTMSNDLLTLFEGVGDVSYGPLATGGGGRHPAQPNREVAASTRTGVDLRFINGAPSIAGSATRQDDEISNIWTELL